jgi:hypothetical protein
MYSEVICCVQAKLRNEPDNLLVLTTTRTDTRQGHTDI